jgi:hypothetical protein
VPIGLDDVDRLLGGCQHIEVPCVVADHAPDRPNLVGFRTHLQHHVLTVGYGFVAVAVYAVYVADVLKARPVTPKAGRSVFASLRDLGSALLSHQGQVGRLLRCASALSGTEEGYVFVLGQCHGLPPSVAGNRFLRGVFRSPLRDRSAPRTYLRALRRGQSEPSSTRATWSWSASRGVESIPASCQRRQLSDRPMRHPQAAVDGG